MERGVARLAAAAAGTSARDGQGVVLYEDAAKRRVNELAGALAALRTLADVAAGFAGDPKENCRQRCQPLQGCCAFLQTSPPALQQLHRDAVRLNASRPCSS